MKQINMYHDLDKLVETKEKNHLNLMLEIPSTDRHQAHCTEVLRIKYNQRNT